MQTPRDTAEDNIASVPGWATWTAAEAAAYIDANVVDLASAKVVMQNMAKIIAELRNAAYPDLEGS
jgi:hypothetical protein